MGQDDVGREGGQFRRVSATVGGVVCGPAGVDPHVAADGPAQARQRLQERLDKSLKSRIVRGSGQEYADAPNAPILLCARGEWPRHCRAAESSNEFAPVHARPSLPGFRFYSITSSARAMSIGGISRPMDFAVPRLITSSNLFGNC